MSAPEVLLRKLITDPEELRTRFAERCVLAKMDKAAAIKQTEEEWELVQRWVFSDSTKTGSFIWCCDFFNIEVEPARRAIREKRQ